MVKTVMLRQHRPHAAGLLLGLLALASVAGCEPRIKPEEFGTPVYEESKLPGAGDPPILLDRETPAES
jgi:hypothetical protein